MKKFFIAVTLLTFLAASCTKTEVSNSSPNPIGFNAQIGKMTKGVILDNDGNVALPTTGYDFGVFSYSITGSATDWSTNGAVSNPIMNNVQTTYQTSAWKATSGKYYWPNDVTSRLTFFAYSPYMASGVTVTKADGITFNDYAVENTSDNIDLMVADQVTDITYSSSSNGAVPMVFNHVLTQVLFKVKTDAVYSNITFTIKELNISAITSNGSYTKSGGAWTAAGTPATTTYTFVTNGTDAITGTTNPISIGSAKALIPQKLIANAQKLNIIYEISGTGVAPETVTKSIDLTTATVSEWTPNMKVTYTLTIGLKEITFTPSVAAWNPTDVSTVL